MKLRYFLPSLLAAGFWPTNHLALASIPRDEEAAKSPSLFDIFKLEHKYNLAAHRSHASHASHGSHRSSGGGGVAPYRPPPAPLYNPTPPQQILPLPPAAPKTLTLPGNSAKFQAIVVQVQTCLSLFGYYPGVINGAVGAETAAAISKFQEQWGFPITGTITPQVLNACGVSAK